MRSTSRTRMQTQHILNVEIDPFGQNPVQAWARNLSVEGMLLQADTTSRQTGTVVQLSFNLDKQNWFIDATVIHTTSSGMGIKFNQPQTSLMRAATTSMHPPKHRVSGRFSLA